MCWHLDGTTNKLNVGVWVFGQRDNLARVVVRNECHKKKKKTSSVDTKLYPLVFLLNGNAGLHAHEKHDLRMLNA